MIFYSSLLFNVAPSLFSFKKLATNVCLIILVLTNNLGSVALFVCADEHVMGTFYRTCKNVKFYHEK